MPTVPTYAAIVPFQLGIWCNILLTVTRTRDSGCRLPSAAIPHSIRRGLRRYRHGDVLLAANSTTLTPVALDVVVLRSTNYALHSTLQPSQRVRLTQDYFLAVALETACMLVGIRISRQRNTGYCW